MAARHEAARADRLIAGAVVTGAGLFAFGLSVATGSLGAKAPLVLILAVLVPLFCAVTLARPDLGIIGVFMVFPIGFVKVPGIPLQVVQLLAVIVAVLIAFRRVAAKTTPLRWSPILWWIVALIGWMIVGLPSAGDKHLAIREIELLASELTFGCAVMGACTDRATARRIMGGMLAVVTAGTITVPFSAGNLQAQFGGAVVEGRATGFFHGKPNTLGIFCALAALVAIGLALGAVTRRGRLLATASAAVIILALLLSLSRGSWIGFGLASIVLMVVLPAHRRTIGWVVAPLVLVAVAVGAFAPSRPEVQVVGQRLRSIVGAKNPYDDRPSIWAEAEREIAADPWTGQGAGNFPVASERGLSVSQSVFADHAHDLLLTWGAEVGLPAIVLLLGITAHVGLVSLRAIRSAHRGGRGRDAAFIAGLAGALVVLAGEGIVEYPGRITVIVIELWGAFGVLLAMCDLETSAAADDPDELPVPDRVALEPV